MLSYTDYMARQDIRSFTLSRDASRIAIIDRSEGTFNASVIDVATGESTRLTNFTDTAARGLAWSADGDTIYLMVDDNGNEQWRLMRVAADCASEPEPMLTNEYHRVALSPGSVSPDGKRLAFTAIKSNPRATDAFILDLDSGEVTDLESAEDNEGALGWTKDGSAVVGARGRNNTSYQPTTWDADTTSDTYGAATRWEMFSIDDQTVPLHVDGDLMLAVSTQDVDKAGLAKAARSSEGFEWLYQSDWELVFDNGGVCGDEFIAIENVDGYGRLLAINYDNGTTREVGNLPKGVIDGMQVRAQAGVVAVRMSTPTSVFNVYMIDIASGETKQVTHDVPASAPSESLVSCELHAAPTAGGESVSCLVYKPEGPGPHPVVVSIHGGPETQERPHYNPFYQSLVAAGIGVIAPNVHGSSGYGKTWQRAIYRDWGGIDMQDFAAVHDFAAGLEWVDASRIGVYGGSYGGFAALSCVSRQPERWACGVSIVGPSNLITFVGSVPQEWRPMMAEWLGDAEKDRDMLVERSPITYADDIRCPLFVIQGANDPRVVKAESDQIVESLRGRGVQVRYHVYDDEGHGFTRRENQIKSFGDVVSFLTDTLKPAN